jgi:hypothetical protein
MRDEGRGMRDEGKTDIHNHRRLLVYPLAPRPDSDDRTEYKYANYRR